MKLNLLALLPFAAAAAQVARAAATPIRRDDWPHGPFYTSGNQIKNANNESVIFVGTNWPGSGESMIPEGIEWRSIADIVSMMKYVGYNFVRHTYAIQMIDQIYENSGTDITVQSALLYALGEENGTKTMEMINKNNPQITNSTTRLEVLSMIAEEEAKQGILMHLDNHISRAIWCCSHDDGNAWFDDMDFNISNWHRGHRYMANWAKNHTNIVSMSLRNELRKSAVKQNLEYNWKTWWGNVSAAAENIHATNPDLLITISGLDYDIDLSALTTQANLLTAPYVNTDMDYPADASSLPEEYAKIEETSFGKAKKAVLEIHAYKQSTYYEDHLEDCDAIQAGLYRFGFNALGESARPEGCTNSTNFSDPYACPPAKLTLPTLLTEFGDAQDAGFANVTMQKCLRDFTTKNKIGWAHWSLAGSYRIRQGLMFNNDTWGLTTPTWDAFQSPETVDDYFRPWIRDMGTTNLEL
ncbi:Glycoside hydrolase, family 5 [Kalmanozyma brasiliensis GHG001]|uniref:Glycoside hydrolase n=1 Tax=Kalmanozyma brasiliensis (strain GHG001) TaxID=1365824 RepID=V5GS28_KALBG|nr:Glycoside hydrolase, family 5 [Kalmanozyma brasiliensis GHG001]EST08742.1 Glycoside hydrolase, family 5 [Kalmanozyma brasiliensis GHG001]